MINVRLYQILLIVLFFMFSIGFVSSAPAAELVQSPIAVRNNFVFYIAHLFMPPQTSSESENKNNLWFSVYRANTNIDMYVFKSSGKTGLIDVETTSVYMGYSHNFYGFDVSLVVPYIYHGAKGLDRTIEGFHSMFPGGGLPNGGREYVQENQIHITYQPQDGGPDINHSEKGFGDPSLYVQKIFNGESFRTILMLGYKPSVGKTAFINSETHDVGVSAGIDRSFGRWYFYVMGAGLYFFGNPEYAKELQQDKKWMVSGAMCGSVRFFDSFSFAIQFYVNSSIFNTGVDRLDNPTVINSYSLKWQITEDSFVQFGVDEDAFTYATTDVAFNLQSEIRF